MAIITDGPRIRTDKFLEEYQSTLPDVLGAQGAESLYYSPGPSFLRSEELIGAEQGPTDPRYAGLNARGPRPRLAPTLIDAGAARKQVTESGVSLTVPDQGITQGALSILIDRKQEERRRQDILSRAPSGVGINSLRVGTSFAASLLDPLNVASAFIPVVGEARYASMLARAGGVLGRTGVRAGVGAIEGGVGQALVEPLVYAAAQQEQADYTLRDSLLNIAFGTVLGGGLHTGAGAIADLANPGRWRTFRPTEGLPRMLDSLDPATREAALRTAIAQAVSGQHVEVTSLIDAFRPGAEARIAETERRIASLQGHNLGGRYSAEIAAAQAELAPFRQLQATQRTIVAMQQNNIGGRFTKQIGELQASAEELIGNLVTRPEVVRAETARVAALQKAQQIQAAHEAELTRLLTKEQPAIAARLKEAKRLGDMSEVDIRAERARVRQQVAEQRLNVRATQSASDQLTTSVLGPLDASKAEVLQRIAEADAARNPRGGMQSIVDAAQRQTRPESMRMADFAASEDATTRLSEAPKDNGVEAAQAELDDAMQKAQDAANTILGVEAPKPQKVKLVVARKMPDGRVVYGKLGQVHADLLGPIEKLTSLEKTGPQMGFAVPGGKFMSRKQALDWLKANEPEMVKPAEATGFGVEARSYNAAQKLAALNEEARHPVVDVSAGDALVARELAPFAELEKTADDYGKAVRAAAACQLRQGS